MSAVTDSARLLLTDLDRLGVELLADGDRLRFRPRTVVDSQMRRRMARHKEGLIEALSDDGPVEAPVRWAQRASALLATVADAERRVALRDLFEERAAICEHDGKLSRAEAEQVAFEELRAAADDEAQQSD